MRIQIGLHQPWVGDVMYAFDYLGRSLLSAPQVDTGHWQAMKDVPQTQTRELRGVSIGLLVPESKKDLAEFVKPNLPWADDHFEERVGGEPLNPGEQFKNWPWYRGNVEAHKQPGQFSHTYMERYWPRFTHDPDSSYDNTHPTEGNQGIRYRYGDLNDVVDLLAREPYTRQAYLPVWFPEDTGATSNQRVPCSLGYHFMLRECMLHCWYDIRSCDFLRHFRDDVYLTARLVQWMIDAVLLEVARPPSDGKGYGDNYLTWDAVKPGILTMNMHSLHIFDGDMPKMRKEYGYGSSSPAAD